MRTDEQKLAAWNAPTFCKRIVAMATENTVKTTGVTKVDITLSVYLTTC